jgi:hypothetical protein
MRGIAMISALPAPLRLLPPAVLLVAACAVLVFGLPPPAFAATLAGSGTAATETRPLGDFEAIAVAGSIDVTVRQAAAATAVVTADDNLLPQVETVVEDGARGRTLKIRLRRGTSLRLKTPVTVNVDVVRLTAIASAGSSDIVVERLDTPSLAVALTGSSDAVLRGLSAGTLSLELSGSCDVRAEGSAARLKLSIAGSGDADLAGLAGDEVSVSIAGSGDARIVANRSLKVSIAGSGDVVYSGQAAEVTSSIAGSGSVRKR